MGLVGVSKACLSSNTANVSMVSTLIMILFKIVLINFSCNQHRFVLSISDHPGRFNDKSLEMIANCWPNMRCLSIGGPSLSSAGLIHIGKHVHITIYFPLLYIFIEVFRQVLYLGKE